MKDPRDIILAPVVSEKSYELIEEGVYTFKVHPSASKPEIRDAVESVFGVTVLKVNTLNRKGKRKRDRRTGGEIPRFGDGDDVRVGGGRRQEKGDGGEDVRSTHDEFLF